MKRIASVLILLTSTILLAQDTFNLHSVYVDNPVDTTMWQARDSKGQISGSRGVWGGTDLDKDGRQEIWVTDYSGGGKIHAFEWYYGDTLVHVWSSAYRKNSSTSGTRSVKTGDLDGDGLGEVIFFAGAVHRTDSTAGLHVYEWDGVTDNGYGTVTSAGLGPTWVRNLHAVFNDTLGYSYTENFIVEDVDGDGQQEIAFTYNGDWRTPHDGGSTKRYYGTKNGSTPYSEDRFIIASVSGDIGVLPQLVEEYSMSPRDVDKDGTRENGLGGGSPQDILVADMDGDSKKELVCISWNNLAVFVIEATGADTYTLGDTTYQKLADSDDWTLAAAVADADKDGKDEVYIPGYYDKQLFIVTDKDGESTTLTSSEWAVLDTTWGFAGGAAASNNAFGDPAVFIEKSGTDRGISMFQYTGTGTVTDSANWTRSDFKRDTLQTGDILKIFAGSNIDRDSFGEVIVAMMGVKDSLYAGTDTAKVNPTSNRVILRVLEYSGKSTDLSIKDMVLITPDDFKLNQNYPNPFNPTTTIEFSLPINSTISISVYNVMGQEVANILPLQDKPAGTYKVNWNGLDKSGNQVASGTYFYTMRFGNFTKTKQMTFMK
jgi:hypothetical protein